MNENIDPVSKQETQLMPTPTSTTEASLNPTNNHSRADEAVVTPKKKPSAWKWLLLTCLVVGLGIFAMTNPELSKYFPDTNTSQTSYSTNKSSSTYSNDNSSKLSNNEATAGAIAAYGGLVILLPVLIGIITVMTFINMVMFMSMSANLGNLRSTLDKLYEIERGRK